MEEMVSKALSWGKIVVGKISVIIDWASTQLSDFTTFPKDNIHTFLVLVLSFWLAGFIFKSKSELKFWIAFIGLFLFFRYLGM